MTELREQLLSARDEYRSVRYPGDLASDVLPPGSPGTPAPRPWGMRTFLVRLTGVAIAAAAVVAVVLVRPPERMVSPATMTKDLRVATVPPPRGSLRQNDSQTWRFPPDLTFASAAAERVKTAASRVQMRMTLPYRDLKMPAMPELPTLPWPDWPRRDRGDNVDGSETSEEAPPAGPSTQQSA